MAPVGAVSLSAFSPPQRIFSYLRKGNAVRFLEDDCIQPAQITLGNDAIWWGAVSDCVDAGWEQFAPTAAGTGNAAVANIERLFTWRFQHYVGREDAANDSPGLVKAYWLLCNKHLGHCCATVAGDDIGTMIARAALHAEFEQAEASLMYRHGMTWEDCAYVRIRPPETV